MTENFFNIIFLAGQKENTKMLCFNIKVGLYWCWNGKKPQKIFVRVGCSKLGVKIIMLLGNKTVKTFFLVRSSRCVILHHHHHHIHEGLGMFPVPWSSKLSWSLHLFFSRPMFLRPFGLYRNACFGILFVSILCTCCSHFFWYCFISFTMFCAPVETKHSVCYYH